MLEMIVSSRIRRALLEYILTRPTERFYLRGLAKTLSLSVSPLRRELKRLEHSGVLRSMREGNMVFYEVETSSPVFQQLRQAALSAPAVSGAMDTSQAASPRASVTVHDQPIAAHAAHAIPIGIISGRRRRDAVRDLFNGPLNAPVLVGVTMLGMAGMLATAAWLYLGLSSRQPLGAAPGRSRPAEIVVVPAAPPRVEPAAKADAPTSGTMRGARWQVVPGGFGGFSAGESGQEAY